MIKKIVFCLAIIGLLGLFYSLGKQVFDSIEVSKRVDNEAEKLIKLQQDNLKLKKKFAESQSIEFIEQQARDKLNFARTGETIVLIPESEIQKIMGLMTEKKEEVIPNWQGWLRLFFK